MFAIASLIKQIVSGSHKSRWRHIPVSDLPPIPSPPSEEELAARQKKYIAEQQERSVQFKINHPPPTIAPGTVLREGPCLLLRQWACQHNSYDITQIIKEIRENNCNYKIRFVEELARNKRLRDQLAENTMFDMWIAQSKNYIIPTNYNSKY